LDAGLAAFATADLVAAGLAARDAGFTLAVLADAALAASAARFLVAAAAACLVFFAVLLTVSFIVASRCLVLAPPASRHFSRQAKAMRPQRPCAPQNRDSLYQTLFQTVDKYVLW
jgi:hypothetical protein